MNKFALDLSKFKKIDMNEKTSTLKNQDGHEIKIDHKKLNPHLKKKLDELPLDNGMQKFDEGGDAQSTPAQTAIAHAFTGQTTAADRAVRTPNTGFSNYNSQPKAKGGSVQRFDEGGEADDTGTNPNAPAGNYTPPDTQMPADIQNLIPNPNNPAGPSPDVGSAGQAAQLAPTQPTAPNDQSDPGQLSQYSQQQVNALQEQKQGAIGKVQAEASIAPQAAAAQQVKQNSDINAYDHYTTANDAVLKTRQELQDAITNQKINPQRYIQEMHKDVGKNIATGLGLVLGGMGAGLTHGPNLAFNYLQSQIANDIDAQKAELGKKENLLSHNFQATGDLRSAYDLTRIHTNDILSDQLGKLAAQAQTPIAKANMLGIKGQFDAQSATLQHGIAVQKALFNSPQGNAQVNPEQNFQNRMQFLKMNQNEPLAKDIEGRHVPGMGDASVPLTPDNRADLTAKQNLHNKLSEYIDYAKNNSGSVDPRVAAIGAAKGAELQGLYRQATHGGVYKEGEADFINKVIDPNPTKFFNNIRGVIPKAQELLRSNEGSLKNLKGSLGLPTQGGGAQASAGPQMKTSKGIQYIRGK